jgi:hypothetical protein
MKNREMDGSPGNRNPGGNKEKRHGQPKANQFCREMIQAPRRQRSRPCRCGGRIGVMHLHVTANRTHLVSPRYRERGLTVKSGACAAVKFIAHAGPERDLLEHSESRINGVNDFTVVIEPSPVSLLFTAP